MRRALYVGAAVACAAVAPESVRAVLASAASVLFECLPYVVATAVLVRLGGGWSHRLAAYAGCGCSGGPAARSIPAAIATAALFGPTVALARFAAAVLFERVRPSRHEHAPGGTPLDDLAGLAPAAAVAAALLYAAPYLQSAWRSPATAIALGLTLGFFAAPCALGSVAIAGALHAQSAPAASAYLCVAGIADANVWRGGARSGFVRDGVAYAVLAVAVLAEAHERGAGLVHPRVACALWFTAPPLLVSAFKYRAQTNALARLIVAVMVFAVVAGAPQPPYVAAETTLDDAFPGERLDFTGVVVRSRDHAALVRYAITCCRADAMPVTVAVALPRNIPQQSWVRAAGVLRRRASGLELAPSRVEVVRPPLDPFVYR